MIVVGLAAMWLVSVALVCAMLRRVTRPPWWETTLLDLDSIELVEERRRSREHEHIV